MKITLFNIYYISITLFTIAGSHFQLLTICKQLICTFCFQAFFQHGPICTGMPGVLLIGQNTHYINDGEIPFLLLSIPSSADRLIFKKLDLISAHIITSNSRLFHLNYNKHSCS